MIRHAIDLDADGVQISENAGDVLVEVGFDLSADEGLAVFGAEDEVVEELRLGAGHQ
jgi:hypothetical protein